MSNQDKLKVLGVINKTLKDKTEFVEIIHEGLQSLIKSLDILKESFENCSESLEKAVNEYRTEADKNKLKDGDYGQVKSYDDSAGTPLYAKR